MIAVAIGSGVAFTPNQTAGWGAIEIDLANPASMLVKITSVTISSHYSISGLIVGSFYKSGEQYVCRDSHAIGDVPPDTIQICSVSFVAEKGDFIGIYWTEGSVNKGSSGGENIFTAAGNHISPGDSAEYTQDGTNARLCLGGNGTVTENLVCCT